MKRLDCAMLAGAALITLALLLILLACGGGGGGSTAPTKKTSEQIEVQLDSGGGIYALFYNDYNLLGITNTTHDYKGAYYLIGSCPQNGVGIDDENNVNSQTQNFDKLLEIGKTETIAGTLHSKTTYCAGATYTFTFTRPEANKMTVRLEIGPLPVEYASLSVPMDFQKDYFDTFRFPGVASFYKMTGSCNNWMTVGGDGEPFASIEPVCDIPNDGATGLAKSAIAMSVEACSSRIGICVKRTIVNIGSYAGIFANNHSGTNNTEINLGNFLVPGSTFFLEEEILIYAKQ